MIVLSEGLDVDLEEVLVKRLDEMSTAEVATICEAINFSGESQFSKFL